MRRSKSNPAKYSKNYRSISQRRMIRDEVDDDAEIKRLRQVLLQSSKSDVEPPGTNAENDVTNDHQESAQQILSAEMISEYGDMENPILPSSRKKSKKDNLKPKVQLTTQEIKAAVHQRKKTERKLQQLEKRHAQKEKRANLYEKLAETALPLEAHRLLTKTATLGKRESKKETLQRLLRLERAGISLSLEEFDLLYPQKQVRTKNSIDEDFPIAETTNPDKMATESKRKRQNSLAFKDSSSNDAEEVRSQDLASSTKTEDASAQIDESIDKSPLSLATQMMASFTTLKSKTTAQAEQIAKEKESADRIKQKEWELSMQKLSGKRYIPSEPIQIRTTQSYEKVVTPSMRITANGDLIREVQRPPEIAAARYELPVVGMEFEIMDAIRNHDVTILCAETGSGKSTQVPQFLYESGLGKYDESYPGMMIGVTQPRRIAAVSTAKRVCYEMGHGNGQTILGSGAGKGNLLAYQTRYETAGLGSQTQIKFMTDGILLQEIQSDLLLRKYSYIILDEAHERNLNTDALIGLISAAIKMRHQAADELPPLKVIIMSATLRVQDFTGDHLFGIPPAVVKVPGRTHPVTIHHSKVTELDDYENAVFRKSCAIHRQLPQGGILVFLTGKHECIRMVNRLRRTINKSDRVSTEMLQDGSVEGNVPFPEDTALRDLDDDELDGDNFAYQDDPDTFENTEVEDDDNRLNTVIDSDNPIPKSAVILPLYSLLSTEEQAKVFAPIPEGHRLIVVATNIAETSITIPGISYVVDSGRQKCRNYNPETGVASFDIMWISKAAADQRAGRAGRTGPGHCYRLYSSSLYSRHMDAFALPEILTRPLEDVVLAMKAMRISNVANFPFPTPPDHNQLDAATKILANIGCVDVSKEEDHDGDGEITRLGSAVAKLPLGVRYGKMLLVAAQAGVLDYAIVIVAALSEANPFVYGGQAKLDEIEVVDMDSGINSDTDTPSIPHKCGRWSHRGGDVLAALLAVGAYTYAGRDSGGSDGKFACRQFCEKNGLNHVIMERIQKMRVHLARLCKFRLNKADGVAAKTGGFLCSMLPPNKLQETLLCQAIASGLLDNVAMLAPFGSIPGDHPFSLRSAYLSCSSTIKEPLFMDRNSVLFSRDARSLPQWICFDSLIRKTHKDGVSIAVMKNITPIEPSWLGQLAKDSRLLTIGEPISSPIPIYDPDCDVVLCSVRVKFGSQGWELPTIKMEMFEAVSRMGKKSAVFMPDDSFRWFARFLLEGKIIPELQALTEMLNDSPSIITRCALSGKVTLLVSELSKAGVDSGSALRKHWAEVNNKFLFTTMKKWLKAERVSDFKDMWIAAVKANCRTWNELV